MNYITLFIWAIGTILLALITLELTLNKDKWMGNKWFKNYKRKKQQRYDLAVWRIHKGIASKKDETVIRKYNG